MKVLRGNAFLPAIVFAAALFLSGCPLPYDYNGRGASNQQTPDPSSPNVTSVVVISYAEQGGVSGSLADNGSFASGKTTTVTLTTTTNNSVIYYTDDGTALTKLDTAKKFTGSSGSITITRTTALQTLDIHAIAVGPSMLPSLPVHGTVSVSPYPIVTVTADKASTPENGGTATFTITSSVPAPIGGITVNLQTSGTYDTTYVSGLPTSGSSFTVLIAASATTVTIPIGASVDPDGVNNTVILTVNPDTHNPPVYTVGAPSTTTVVIQDNHTPTLTLTGSPSSVPDNGQTMVFTVTSSFSLTTDLTVNLQTSGSYKPGDVTGLPASGSALSVTLPAGATSVSMTVTTNPDPGDYNNQVVRLDLVANSAYNIGSPSGASVTELDTSPIPLLTLGVSPSSIVDGQSATFTVTANTAPDANQTLLINSSGYTAGKVIVPTSVVLPAGATSVTFSVSAPSQVGYAEQNAVISLVAGVGHTLGSPSALGLQVTDNALGAFTWDGVWNFTTNAGTNVGTGSGFSLSGNVVLSGGVLTFGGVYPTDDATVSVPTINKNQFTLGVKFTPADVSTNHSIIGGGTSYRWLIVQTSPTGDLSIDLNNHSLLLDLGVTLAVGTSYTLVIDVDVASLTLTAWLNGVAHPFSLPGGFVWNNPTGDNVLTSTDFSTGHAFQGTWDWVFSANGLFDYNTVLNLMATDPDL